MIELRHVFLNRDGRDVLRDVDVLFDRGEFVLLLGPTGAGKSSILELIYFEQRPTRGAVFVGEYDSETIRERDIPYLRRRVGVIFQNCRLLPNRTVYENVAFAAQVTGSSRSEVKRRTMFALAAVDLTHRRGERPESLSGGELQRAAIARALVNDPQIILADEPTANLDPESSRQVYQILSEANVRGTSVIMATHDESYPIDSRHRVLRVEGGRLVEGRRP